MLRLLAVACAALHLRLHGDIPRRDLGRTASRVHAQLSAAPITEAHICVHRPFADDVIVTADAWAHSGRFVHARAREPTLDLACRDLCAQIAHRVTRQTTD